MWNKFFKRSSNQNKKPASSAWQALEEHQKKLRTKSIKDLFQADPKRAEHFTLQHEKLIFDYSKNRITDQTTALLCSLAREKKLEGWRDDMFAGKAINTTENRAVLHPALRGSTDFDIEIDGMNVAQDAAETLGQIERFCQKIDSDNMITDIVNIGIGGSDIGPHLVCRALKSYARKDRNFYFLSNVDPAAISEILEKIDPEKALFIISSKSFTTQETMTNAQTAKDWLAGKLGDGSVAKHFVSVTGNQSAALSFGILQENIFPLRDWIGGRYSVWSAIGLPIALSIGFDNFKKLLAGAYSADQHFKTQPLEKNIPVLMGLLGIWYRNFWAFHTYAVLPYHHDLAHFPRYIQQIEMESNGKSTGRGGQSLDYDTAPVVFGDVGTNGQHAFHQHLHQGTQIVPCDFLAFAKASNPQGDHQDKLLANALAQAEALMLGAENVLEAHRHFEGNRPSNFILMDALTPYNLGMLMAFYEHRVFVQGIIWEINSFDQYGVELGKKLTRDILESLQTKNTGVFDSSTQSLIEKINRI